MTRMMCELFGKSHGFNGGRGGSMHIGDTQKGMLGANAIVGGGIPIAVGAAFASQYRGDGTVAASFFGDGATNIGAFHEAANFAAVWDLPVLFVCENNGYAEFTAQGNHMKLDDIAERAASYGIPGVVVDGMDVLAVRSVAIDAVDRAKRGEGPTLIGVGAAAVDFQVGTGRMPAAASGPQAEVKPEQFTDAPPSIL